MDAEISPAVQDSAVTTESFRSSSDRITSFARRTLSASELMAASTDKKGPRAEAARGIETAMS
jgi:hypothetical protein